MISWYALVQGHLGRSQQAGEKAWEKLHGVPKRKCIWDKWIPRNNLPESNCTEKEQRRQKLFYEACVQHKHSNRRCNKQNSSCIKQNIGSLQVWSNNISFYFFFFYRGVVICLSVLWPGNWTRGLQRYFATWAIPWIFLNFANSH